MLSTQTRVFDVAVALSTILSVQENNSYQRSFFFHNLSTGSLSVQIEYSADGGTTWTLVEPAFSIAAGAITAKEVTNLNILRVRASGGGDDRDLYIGYSRMFLDTGSVTWVKPLL